MATSGGRRADADGRAAPRRRARRRAVERGTTRCTQFSSVPQRATTNSASVEYGGGPGGSGCHVNPPEDERCAGHSAYRAASREQFTCRLPSSNHANVRGCGHVAGCAPHGGPEYSSRARTPRPKTKLSVRMVSAIAGARACVCVAARATWRAVSSAYRYIKQFSALRFASLYTGRLTSSARCRRSWHKTRPDRKCTACARRSRPFRVSLP